jgi:hypothetical protein
MDTCFVRNLDGRRIWFSSCSQLQNTKASAKSLYEGTNLTVPDMSLRSARMPSTGIGFDLLVATINTRPHL